MVFLNITELKHLSYVFIYRDGQNYYLSSINCSHADLVSVLYLIYTIESLQIQTRPMQLQRLYISKLIFQHSGLPLKPKSHISKLRTLFKPMGKSG